MAVCAEGVVDRGAKPYQSRCKVTAKSLSVFTSGDGLLSADLPVAQFLYLVVNQLVGQLVVGLVEEGLRL